MSVEVWIVVAAVVVLLLGVLLVVVARSKSRSRRAALREHFGPEYDRVIDDYGRAAGERELRARLKQRRSLSIRALDADERTRFATAWESAQATFVETPSTGLRDADRLVTQVMRERGYPVEHFSEREKMMSVDHPDLVEHFRSAHSVAVANETDTAGTEQLRQAMVDHRYLFDGLLSGGDPDRTRRIG